MSVLGVLGGSGDGSDVVGGSGGRVGPVGRPAVGVGGSHRAPSAGSVDRAGVAGVVGKLGGGLGSGDRVVVGNLGARHGARRVARKGLWGAGHTRRPLVPKRIGSVGCGFRCSPVPVPVPAPAPVEGGRRGCRGHEQDARQQVPTGQAVLERDVRRGVSRGEMSTPCHLPRYHHRRLIALEPLAQGPFGDAVGNSGGMPTEAGNAVGGHGAVR